LRDLSHAACIKSSQTEASYMRMKHVLSGVIGASDEANNDKKNMCYGPVLPQAVHAEPHSEDRVLDPLQVKSRGTPKKKRMKGFLDKPKRKRKRKCMSCKKTGHDRRTCKEQVNYDYVRELIARFHMRIYFLCSLVCRSCKRMYKRSLHLREHLVFGTKTGKKRKALLAEEEDFVEDYISDSSRTNNVADDESEEGNSENEDDGEFKLASAMIFLATC
jgi:hypothetical protein